MCNVVNNKGFSLAEVLVAILIIAVIAIAGLEAPVFIKRGLENKEDEFFALRLAGAQLEHLKEIAKSDFASTDLSGSSHSAPTVDIRDEDPYYNDPLNPSCGISYDITNGTNWGEDAADPAGDTDYKIITVTFTYPDGRTFVIRGYAVE